MELWIPGTTPRVYSYRVAGRALQSAVELPELHHDSQPPRPGSVRRRRDDGEELWVQTFAEETPLGRAARRVSAFFGPAGYRIEVAGGGSHRVSPDGQRLICAPPGPEAREAWVETVLGPVLILALALRDVFCLHASAVAYGNRAAVFLGDSGAGKSTLAARLAAESGFQRLADDVLPVTPLDGGRALPGFPQLALPPDQQPSYGDPRGTALGALFFLDSGGEERTQASSLPAARALAALLRQTVASRIFAPDLLQRQFETLSDLADTLPAYSLRYPWTAVGTAETAVLVRDRL